MDAKQRRHGVPIALSFNPRARDGRERVKDVLITDWKVSIHAPVMDANG